MLKRLGVFPLTMLMTAALGAWAGESGLNVIVVANQNSSNSLQLANDYCELRHVPPQNLFRMTGWTGGSIQWQQSDFETYLLDPLLAMISIRGLTNQAEIVLLSMDVPYRVLNGDGVNGTTSALFYGFKTNTTPPPGLPDSCSLPEDSANSYAFSELPFALAEPGVASTNAFLAMMLTDTNLAAAESVLRRGAASDSTFPSETVYLQKTSDGARNVRFVLFDSAIQECRARGDNGVTRITSNSTTESNALGLDTGLFAVSVATNAFVPGTVADNLDSFGGYIFENNSETSLLALTEAGASASYGTVVEPCNYTDKFPDPMVYFYQNRGFCLAEAYYQSLANPYQGVMIGEPLSAPFARRGSAVWNSPVNNSVLSGLATFNVSFTAADTNHPLSQVDLFVDGRFFQTVTNLAPGAGNVLSVTINGVASSYTNASGDSLGSSAIGLATALMAQENITGVEADSVGDRLVLRSQDVAIPGSEISVQSASVAGSASDKTSFASTAMPTFLDSTAYGYHAVEATNNPNAGDWLQLTFIKTNGLQVSVAVTNTQSGASLSSFLQTLIDQINATPALQSADGANASDLVQETGSAYGFLINAASPGWPAAQVETIFTGSADLGATPTGTNALDDNANDLKPRAHIYLSSGAVSLLVQFSLDTTGFPDGFHDLTAVAYEGTSVRTQTWAQETVQFHNTQISATFFPIGGDSNGNLQFAIAANATNIMRIELFSTGGSIAVATNQATAAVAAPAATLGVGLHPFYAIVTDSDGHQYQTQTVWEQVPALQLSVTGLPMALIWPAITGRQYTVLAATNLSDAFRTDGFMTATNGQARWPITNADSVAKFYRVSVMP